MVQPKKKRVRKKDPFDWDMGNMYPGLGKWPGLGQWKGFKGGKKK